MPELSANKLGCSEFIALFKRGPVLLLGDVRQLPEEAGAGGTKRWQDVGAQGYSGAYRCVGEATPVLRPSAQSILSIYVECIMRETGMLSAFGSAMSEADPDLHINAHLWWACGQNMQITHLKSTNLICFLLE